MSHPRDAVLPKTQALWMLKMAFYCPNCGTRIDGNVFFQITGQCMCHECGEIVDLTSVASEPPDDSGVDEDPWEDDTAD